MSKGVPKNIKIYHYDLYRFPPIFFPSPFLLCVKSKSECQHRIPSLYYFSLPNGFLQIVPNFSNVDIIRRPATEWERYALDLRCKHWVFLVGVQSDDAAGMFQAQVVGNFTTELSIVPCNFLTKHNKTVAYKLEVSPIDIRYLGIVNLIKTKLNYNIFNSVVPKFTCIP